jgi:hypothetical protein
MTGRSQTLQWWLAKFILGGRKGKDDRKQNTLAPFVGISLNSHYTVEMNFTIRQKSKIGK